MNRLRLGDEAEPSRLIDEGAPGARLLRGSLGKTTPAFEEARAWARVSQRLSPGPARARWLGVAAVTAVALVSMGVAVRLRTESPTTTALASAPPVIETLPAGPRLLVDAVAAELSPEGQATAHTTVSELQVTLARGALRLATPTGRKHRALRVQAGGYTFTDIGTTFRVTRQANDVRLDVLEGRVRVENRSGLVADVTAGQTWRGAVAGPPLAAPAAEPVAAPAEQPSAVLHAPGHVAGRTRPRAAAVKAECTEQPTSAALACYRRVAASSKGLSAEVALYESGLLRLRKMGDLEGAAAQFEAHRTRFPKGALRAEVSLSLLELLPKLGRYDEALSSSARLLSDPAVGRERAAELHLLRGNLYREAFRDCARAAVEYERVATGGGQAAYDAKFWRAVCLETSAPDQAQALLREVARDPGSPHRHAAEARLSGPHNP